MGFFDFMSGGEDPSKKAMPYLDKIPGTISPYYDPYISKGNQALNGYSNQSMQNASLGNGLNNTYGQMMNDPSSIYNKIGEGYTSSPGYNFALQQALGAINNSAAAGGMTGTPQHQQNAGQMATNLANQDYERYFQNALGLFGGGLQGQQGMYNQGYQGLGNLSQMGYGASNQLAQSLGQNLQNQAGLEYAGQANQNQSRGGFFGNVLGAGLGAGAGYMMGGLPDAAYGAYNGSGFGR